MDKDETTREQIKSESVLFAKHLRVFEILDDTRMTEKESDKRNKRGEVILLKAKGIKDKYINDDKLKKIFQNLGIEDVEKMVANLKNFLERKIKEKISGPKERYGGRLESTLTPLIKLNHNEDPMKVLSDIYYRLVKDHPFLDGNKKIAAAFLIKTLSKLNIEPSDQDIADITVYIARSDAKNYAVIAERMTNYLNSI